eukprot:6426046-Amphidinium_carterae.1
MEREAPEGSFSFLFQHDSPDNVYYRWRAYSFAQGDNFQHWRTETFRVSDTGMWWKPPPCHTKRREKKRATNFSSAPMLAAAAALAASSSKPSKQASATQPAATTASMSTGMSRTGMPAAS